MQIVAGGLACELPSDWVLVRQEPTTFRGPNGEHATVSGVHVPSGEEASHPLMAQLTTEMVDIAASTLRDACSRPDPRYELMQPLSSFTSPRGVQLWIGLASSPDRRFAVTSFVAAHAHGVALVTLEGPYSSQLVAALEALVASASVLAQP